MAKTGKNGSKSKAKKTNTKSRAKAGAKTDSAARPIRREIGAVVCLFLGIFSAIGYFNVDALFIQFFCGFVKGLIGWGYILFPPAMLLCAYILGFHKGKPVVFRLVSALLLPLLLGAFVQLFALNLRDQVDKTGEFLSLLYRSGQELRSGGLIAGLIGQGVRKLFSVYGATPLLLAAIAFFAISSLNIKLSSIVAYFRNRPKLAYEPIEEEVSTPAPNPKRETVPMASAAVSASAVGLSAAENRRRTRHVIDIPLDGEQPPEDEYAESRVGLFNTKSRVKTPDQLFENENKPKETNSAVPPEQPERTKPQERFHYEPSGLPVNPPEAPKAKMTGVRPGAVVSDSMDFIADGQPVATAAAAETLAEVASPAAISASVMELSDPPKPVAKVEKIKADEVAAETENIAKAIEEELKEEKPAYEYPPLALLKSGSQSVADSRGEISINRERLETTLHSFGVNASIASITRGPTVTRYDIELEAGVKLTKITNLSNDLALSLGVSSVRIAPIPDKIATVGIEVPNKMVSTVYLRDILGEREFQNAP